MALIDKFALQPGDIPQLQQYLRHDPNWVCAGIPDVIIRECEDILDLYSNLSDHITHDGYTAVLGIFTKQVFEKALLMIFNRPILVDDENVIAAGVAAHRDALCDLTEGSMDEISDEARAELTDWDNGMIAGAIIKACGRAAIEQMSVPA